MVQWGKSWGPSVWGTPLATAQVSLSLSVSAKASVTVPGLRITERITSRQFTEDGNGRKLQRVFAIHGTDDPTKLKGTGPQRGDIYDASVGSAETGTDDRLIVANRSTRPLSTGEKACEMTVFYEEVNRSVSSIGRQVNLNIAGRSVKIEEAFAQVHFPTGDADDLDEEWGKTIGPKSKDGKLQGVERIDTTMDYSVTAYRSIMSVGYVNTLLALHTKVNNASFHGFGEKTMLFQGARASRSGNGLWQVQLSFIINPIRMKKSYNNILAADGGVAPVQTIDIKGFEYLWFEHAEKLITTTKNKKKVLSKAFRSAHVATIYEGANFGGLEIGTAALYNSPAIFSGT